MTPRRYDPDPDIGRAWIMLLVTLFVIAAAFTALRTYSSHHPATTTEAANGIR